MSSLLPSHSSPQINDIVTALNAQFDEITQADRPPKSRTQTARSYASALRALAEYMQTQNAALPTRSLLDAWRDDMLQGRLTTEKGKVLAINSVNVRLGAVRALLRGAAVRLPRPEQRLLLRGWAEVEDARAIFRQDMLSEEYGIALSFSELKAYIRQIKPTTIKGLRDRALVMGLAGAGLRVSEVVRLTLADVFLTQHPNGLRGLRVRHGPHRKSRIVVLGTAAHPVFQAVSAYVQALGLPVPEPRPLDDDESLPDLDIDWSALPRETFDGIDFDSLHVFRSLKRGPLRQPVSTERRLSPRSVERIVRAYPARHHKKRVHLMPLDLRRTFVSLCQETGMSWEALQEQLGRAYPHQESLVDWAERVPRWTLKGLED